MLFAYVSGVSEDDKPELCIVADKPSSFSVPIKVKTLRPTEAAVHIVSNDEGVTVTIDAQDHGTVIAAIPPNPLYLTPNLPHRPGFQVDRVKVVPQGKDEVITFFDRGRGWESWTPNQRLY